MISFQAQPLFSLGFWHVTDAEIASVAVTFGLVLFAIIATRKWSIVPTRVQLCFELLADYILDTLETSLGSKERARAFFPLLMTTVIFIAVANQFSVIPFVMDLTLNGGSVFRVPTTDINQTLTLGIFMVALSHVLGFAASPLRHVGQFFNISGFLKMKSLRDFPQALLDFVLGLLDIVSEFSKVISISFRLFGNMFAGEVMVAVIASMAAFTAYFVPLPFIVLSIFSGVIQAFVFTLLSVQYIAASVAFSPEVSHEKASVAAI